MSASPIARHVYRETLDHFGEPDAMITFDDPPPPDESWPPRIDVLIWFDDDEVDITTFATVGMCDRPLEKVDHRCEIHMAIRRPATELDLNSVAGFCANLATYPFANQTYFEWAQTIRRPGSIPYFPNCTALLLHPAFVEEGWDSLEFEGLEIRIMYVVPISNREVEYRDANGPHSIFDHFADHEIDVFVDRDDSAGR
jgi:Suppressor of fused protein (SUFU)